MPPSQKKFSQVLDYCLAYNIRIGLLLYPKLRDEINHSYRVKNSDVEVRVAAIDISCIDKTGFLHNLDQLIDSLLNIINSQELLQSADVDCIKPN
jgi:hypothetical protein